MWRKIIVLSSLVLAACGGGGESSSTSSDTSQSLKFNGLTSGPINETFTDLNAGKYAKVAIAYAGSLTQPVDVVVEDTEQMFKSASVDVFENNKAGVVHLKLGFADRLKAGTYASSFKIHACASSQIVNSNPPTATCVGEYPGSPVTIPRNVVVQPLQLDKTSVNFVANGGTPATTQMIKHSAGTDKFVDAKFEENDSINRKVAIYIDKEKITLIPLPQGVAGHYTGTLTVSADGYKRQQVTMSYDVVSPELAHGIYLYPFNDKFLNKTVDLNKINPNEYTYLNWEKNNYRTKIQNLSVNYESGSGWIKAVFDYDRYKISYVQNGINTAGLYKANIVLTTDTAGIIDTYTIPVSLTVK